MDRKVHNAFHISLLKPHDENKFGKTVEPPPLVQIEGREEGTTAEMILSLKKRCGNVQYLVEWMGYPD